MRRNRGEVIDFRSESHFQRQRKRLTRQPGIFYGLMAGSCDASCTFIR